MDGAGGAEHLETVIIGGGQAGLSVGYHLARRGRRFVILDANQRVGDAWRKRWDSLRLFTPARYDGLPGWPFPAPAWSFPTKDEVADYLEAYAARFDLPVRTGVRVDGLSRQADRYVVAAGDRRLEADHVVVAAGAYQRPRVPAFAPQLDPGIVQLHSSQYRDPSQLQEGGVLVVGAANSGAEIALEVSRDHRTWLSGRHPGQEPFRPGSRSFRLLVPVVWFMASRVLTVRTPIGRAAFRKFHHGGFQSRGLPLARVRPKDVTAAGIERVPRTAGVRGGLPVLDDGRDLEVANVVWCTGFVPDFAWVDLPVFAEDGGPVHDRGVVESEPGLYFVGLVFLYALASSLVGGVGSDAEHIAEQIAFRQPDGRSAAEVLNRSVPRRPTGLGLPVSSFLGVTAGGHRCRHAPAEACDDQSGLGGRRRDRGLRPAPCAVAAGGVVHVGGTAPGASGVRPGPQPARQRRARAGCAGAG
jgi:putative flavoprotein involved in K+ transport